LIEYYGSAIFDKSYSLVIYYNHNIIVNGKILIAYKAKKNKKLEYVL